MPRTAGRTRARRAGAILAVAVAVGAVLMPVVSATTAPTATAAPGIPENPSVAWSEDFENGQGNTPTGLGSYTSATGSTYTGTTFWLDYANCNGVILNYLASRAGNGDVVTFPTPFCTTPTVATAQNNARRMADVLGQVAAGVVGGATATTPVNGSTAATQANHALAEWTTLGAAGTPNQLVVGNTAPLGLTATTSRYYTPSIDVVEASCAYLGGANNSRLNMFLVISGAETLVTPTAVRACTDPRATYYSSPVPQGAGANPWESGGDSVRAGRFPGTSSILLTPAQLATVSVRVRNESTATDGNDFGIDNIRVLDATPSLDKGFAPATIPRGGTSTLTFTITNSTDLASKIDMGFVDALPAGLVVANTPAIGGTCTSTTGAALVRTAPAAGSTITVSGVDFAAGATACTVTVTVTAANAGTYTNGPANVTTNLNPPDPATLAVTAPSTITLRKNIVARAVATDQFRLDFRTLASNTLLGDGSTTGATLGDRIVVGPTTVTSGTTYRIRERAATGSGTNLNNYTTAWRCVDGATVLSSGTGTAVVGQVTIPAATVAGVNVVCTYTNAPLRATVTVSKTVQDATGANPQPGSGWVLGAATGAGATATPTATTQTTTATGSVSWSLAFANSTASTTVTVSETQKPTHDFVSGQCVVTSITGATRTVPFSAATGGPVTGVIAGDTVACGFVNRAKPATLTLAATVASGSAAPSAFTISAVAPSGALTGPTGQTGTPAVTAIPVTANTAYQLTTAGPSQYVPTGPWTCVDQNSAAVTVTAGTVSVAPGTQVTCAVAFTTAQITLVKQVIDPAPGFGAADWTLTATPGPLAGGSLPVESRTGAEYVSGGNAANTFEVRPGHAYTLAEALTDLSSPLAYRHLRLERLDGAIWTPVTSAAIAAPAGGQTVVYRFVNDRVPAVILPLTGGPSSDAVLIAGGVILAFAIAAGVWHARRRSAPLRPPNRRGP